MGGGWWGWGVGGFGESKLDGSPTGSFLPATCLAHGEVPPNNLPGPRGASSPQSAWPTGSFLPATCLTYGELCPPLFGAAGRPSSGDPENNPDLLERITDNG